MELFLITSRHFWGAVFVTEGSCDILLIALSLSQERPGAVVVAV